MPLPSVYASWGMAIQPGDAEQSRQVDRAIDRIQLGFMQVELFEQVIGQMFGARIRYFQTYCIAVPT